MSTAPVPGPAFLALSVAPGREAPDLRDVVRLLGGGTVTSHAGGMVVLRLGMSDPAENPDGTDVDLLSLAPRRHERALDARGVKELFVAGDRPDTREVLPPFAAAAYQPGSGLTVAADPLGYRHVYHREDDGWTAVSTSARALAACRPSGIDRRAVGTQTLLGWHVGLDTPFAKVRKLPPGATITLRAGELRMDAPRTAVRTERRELDDAVAEAADVLRGHVHAVLEDHPDIVLQLTGGQDSRVLLGAIEPARRRGMEVMTLASPGNPDAEIAAALARRFGMHHRTIDLDGLEGLDPHEAHALAVAAAARLDCSANPIALASVAWAEAQLDQRPRLAGLGGEVARGFYYLGPYRDMPVTLSRVRRLAEWRMFTNEAVPAGVLDPRFVSRTRSDTLELLFETFTGHSASWFEATDEFYLMERMHRWSGVLASTTALDRITINPMLDDRFLTIARSLHPRDKQNSLFLSRLSCALDEELSSIPLDGRPAPQVFARPGLANRARLAASTANKVVGKARQRLSGVGRPPAGAAVITPKIAEYYRGTSTALDGVRELGVFRTEWLDDVVRGTCQPDPASTAMLVNLEVLAAALNPG